MEGQGLGVRGWGSGQLLALGCFAIISVTASAAAGGDSKGENLRITVMVYNYAKVPGETLSQAGKVTAGVFKAVGVDLDWVDCPITPAEPSRNPACRESSPTMPRLRILPDVAPEARTFVSNAALGFAVTVPRPEHGCLASVYYDRVRERAEEIRHLDWQLLGFAIAHEIGHLLLGSNSHSRSGLMRAKGDEDAMAWAVRGMLILSQEEARAIRAGIVSRVAESEGSQRLLPAGAKRPTE